MSRVLPGRRQIVKVKVGKKQNEHFNVCVHKNVYTPDIHNIPNNTQVRSKIYRELYHDIVCIANEGRHIRPLLYFDE